MSPKISLITTTYNRQQYLAQTIESILAQTDTDFELLIWDDGSTDLSPQIARYYALRDTRVRLVKTDHQGNAPALKAAIAQTTGQYIGWVDSDDLLAPTALAKTAPVLEACPEVGLVYTNYHVIDAQGKPQGLGQRCAISYSKERLLVDFMTFQFRLIRRSVYEQVGGIDATFEQAADYDLCLRLSEITEFQHLPQILYGDRKQDSNTAKDQFEAIRLAYQASTQALQRRGLEQDHVIDLRLQCIFTLHPKQPVSSVEQVQSGKEELPTATAGMSDRSLNVQKENCPQISPGSFREDSTNHSIPTIEIVPSSDGKLQDLEAAIASITHQPDHDEFVTLLDTRTPDETTH